MKALEDIKKRAEAATPGPWYSDVSCVVNIINACKRYEKALRNIGFEETSSTGEHIRKIAREALSEKK